MKVKIKYFNMLREAVGIKEETFTFFSIPTIQVLLDEACLRHNAVLKEKLFTSSGEMKPAILIFLNSILVSHNQLDHKLADNDEVYNFTLIHYLSVGMTWTF